MKAQVWSMDFAASATIFMLSLILLIFALGYTIDQNSRQTGFNLMQSAAMSVSDSLVRQPGIPEGWNSTNVSAIGLVSEENILNQTKVSEFLGMSSDSLKSLLGIGGYEFYFEVRYSNGSLAALPDGTPISKGVYPSDAGTVIPVERYVIYTEKPARLEFILWE